MSLRANIKRGKIIINPSTASGTSIFFTEGFFTNPPAVNLTASTSILIYLEETSSTHFSIRINSNLNQNITIHYVAIERLSYEESTMSARDFLATRTRTESIIGGGSATKLVVYSKDNATDNSGGKSTELQSRIGGLGNEVYFYVDGVPDGKENNTAGSVAAFGGDVVVSGKLYANTFVSSGESSSLWELDSNSDLTMSGILDYTNGAFSIDLNSGSLDYNSSEVTIDSLMEEIQNINSYTLSNRSSIAINDTYFEFDSSGNIMPKLAS